MTFCGGETAEEGLEIPGKGNGVEIGCRTGSLLPLRDFRRDFMLVKRVKRRVKEKVIIEVRWPRHSLQYNFGIKAT